jgi:hypothetical protein
MEEQGERLMVHTVSAFLCANAQAIVSSCGLLFDIAGAWLVAWEVVRQFQGERVQVSGGVLRSDHLGSIEGRIPVVVGQQAAETDEYKAWERRKYGRMKLGLALLTVGFGLQAIATWMPK